MACYKDNLMKQLFLKSIRPLTVLFFMLFSATGISQTWEDSLERASKTAQENAKNILLYFGVTDRCDWCGKLEINVFSNPDFINFADKKYVLVKPEFNDTDNEEEKIKKLLVVEKYNKDGFFPYVIILNSALKVLGKMPVYNGESVVEVISWLRKIE
jgi:thioredoxin-related protein